MAFFDDFSKKLSQAGQATIQKTKELADIAKVNSMIMDEEKKITDLYLEIGKRYVEIHAIDAEEEFQQSITALEDAKKKIKELKEQIMEIKGAVKCSNCGAEVPAGSAFCATCGAQISVKKEEVVTAEVEETPAEEVAVVEITEE